MHIREAQIADYPQLHTIRMAVKENILSNPLLVTEQHYKDFITVKGKGWVAEIDEKIAGFAIIDLEEKNIWALFVDPRHEGKGIGKTLHQTMLNWYFSHNNQKLWLSTEPGTKAEIFYKKNGWLQKDYTKSGEILFEITKEEWENVSSKDQSSNAGAKA